MPTSAIEKNPLLFGRDQRTGIIAIEPAGRFIRLFFRNAGEVTFHDEIFHPFILTADPSAVSSCHVPCAVRELSGAGYYRYQLRFDSWNHCLLARDSLAARYGGAGHSSQPYLFIPDIAHQYMLASGTTLFKGFDFGTLRTLALDIETASSGGYEFSNPDRIEDRIISIALSDSHGEEVCLRGDKLGEPELLHALNRAIAAIDPDIITGHNVFRFDLNYIGGRAALHGIALNWGRNGAPPHVTPHARFSVAEKTIEYPRWDVYGRHIVDTYFLALLYDVAARNLENHSLKYLAKNFNIAAPQRTYLDGEEIYRTFSSDPERLYRYNLDDARETLDLFRLLGYPWFLQSRIFPYSLQNCVIRGNATRINSLFLREYLYQGCAIPAGNGQGVPFEGGYTSLPQQGVFEPIIHCDVASLYPSLMLTYRIASSKDRLGLFLPMLEDLRSFRLTAKQLARKSSGSAEKQYYESLQQLFKTLINSFYGYLGASRHNFSDPAAAAEVTRLGRVTIRNMIDMLAAAGAGIIEVDTDGIYFTPPQGCDTEAAELELINAVSAKLPEGIEAELDGRYRAMFAYKSKNYALLGYDGRVILKGSGLRSRGIESYLRDFIRDAAELFLTGRGGAVRQLLEDYLAKLRSPRLDVGWIARSETLNESPDSYREKLLSGRRNHSAAFETALASGKAYKAGDRISYYVSGSGKDATAYRQCRPLSSFDPVRPDINVAYYSEKLRQIYKRFEAFMPQEPTLFDF